MKFENKTMIRTKKKIEALTASLPNTYGNDLYFTSDAVPEKEKKKRTWTYGWNRDYNIVVISKDGTLGEVIEVQGLKIGLPAVPEKVHSRSPNELEQWWEREEVPDEKSFKKLKTTAQLQHLGPELRDKWEDYIIRQWDNRDAGTWFMCKGKPTYITGSHYFYMHWAKIDVGYPGYRDANRIFWYFWEASKADKRCFGMCYLKNRRSGFSYMASSELVNQATMTANSQYGILSMTGDDAKKMFVGKVVPLANSLPFFFQPIRAGESVPKSELLYQVPSTKLTKRKIEELMLGTGEEEMTGLDSKIDWKATNENSYDGQKLKLLAHDESGKWPTGNDIRNNWNIAKTCLRLGSKIIGKCMMGSTCNKQSDGGAEFKELYYNSDLRKGQRNKNGQTKTGLYSLFIPMEWNYESHFDIYGYPIFDTPEEGFIINNAGDEVEVGVIDEWNNEIAGLKSTPATMNEWYRQFPRTESHAFRDEISGSIFNLAKIQDQIDHNDSLDIPKKEVLKGSFYWKDGVKDTEVLFREDLDGRFKVNWLPPKELRNNTVVKDGLFHPGNEWLGGFGCDSYDISGTVYGSGSNGALSGVTAHSLHPDVPNHRFFLEYIARPQTVEIFFEEVLMACVYYGMPILVENNKPRLLYYLRDRGYRKFSLRRPDRPLMKLSDDEKFLGGIPNSSQDVIQTHAAGIESWIEQNVGYNAEGNMGYMAFNRTLEDWMWFDIKKRTVYDATIASGLAIMGVNRLLFNNERKIERKFLPNPFGSYDNGGNTSVLKHTK